MIPETLPGALAILSAMITPAILILASGSLIVATTTRLGRVVDRVRELSREMGQLYQSQEATSERKKLIFHLLARSTSRARLLQKAVTRLYLAVGMFIGTSIAIALIAAFEVPHAWVALVLGFVGAILLLSASVLLILESRIGLSAVYAEMDYVLSLGRELTDPELLEEVRKR